MLLWRASKLPDLTGDVPMWAAPDDNDKVWYKQLESSEIRVVGLGSRNKQARGNFSVTCDNLCQGAEGNMTAKYRLLRRGAGRRSLQAHMTKSTHWALP